VNRRTVGVLLLVLLLATPRPSSADVIPIIEIINTVILAKINSVLSTLILYEEKLLDRANVDIYNRYRNFFATEGVLFPIQTALAEIRGIRNEVSGIACGWQFSPRTAVLRQLYLEPARLCRPSFQLIWGSNTAAVDRDLQELEDYVGVMTANQLATLSQSQETFARVFPDAFRPGTGPGFSPGEANRMEASMLAQAGQVALSNNQTANQSLLVAEMERELERREERHLVNASLFAMQGLSTLGGPVR
jgi:hypothetical protein